MSNRTTILITALILSSTARAADEAAVAAVLDDWRQAAARADEERYFSHFAKDAVFFGTDATERWNTEQFRAYARPHFAAGKAWTFKALKRRVTFAKEGTVAWFDEELETKNLGPCRGTGVAVLDSGRWKIAQYNLSTPIPNEIFAEVKKLIDAALAAKEQPKP